MKKIIDERSVLNNRFGIHQANRGDLVSISYLDKVKRFQERQESPLVKLADDTGSKNIDLYIYGDSYLLGVPDSVFNAVHSYHYCRAGVPGHALYPRPAQEKYPDH
ncbi:MAG: hypothetical protein WDM78_20255 [Puia sp.]